MRTITTTSDIKTLYTDERLNEALDLIDTLHSAASDDSLGSITTQSKRELVGMLRELIYTAQETIAEIEKQGKASGKPILQLIATEMVGKRQA